jgi:hypothetical protein
MSIEDRALGDQCYWALLNAINAATQELHYVPEDLRRLPALLTDTYFCNFSLFQSTPDVWAIEQLFPIAPIHRLDERPVRSTILADLTCDSDGKIERFIGPEGVQRFLDLHKLRKRERYTIGVFLVGAYQEILGDLHNLFGDTPDGRMVFANVLRGDTVGQVLRYVAYEKADLMERWRHALEAAVHAGRITAPRVERCCSGSMTRCSGTTRTCSRSGQECLGAPGTGAVFAGLNRDGGRLQSPAVSVAAGAVAGDPAGIAAARQAASRAARMRPLAASWLRMLPATVASSDGRWKANVFQKPWWPKPR